MVTKEWTAVHRKHHAKCETEEDPHSPQVLGLKKVLLEGSELYRKGALDKETLDMNLCPVVSRPRPESLRRGSCCGRTGGNQFALPGAKIYRIFDDLEV